MVELTCAAAFENLNFENVVVEPSSGNPFNLPNVIEVPGWSFSEFDPPGLLWHIGNVPQQFLSSDLYFDDNSFPIGTPLEGHFSLAMGLGYSDSQCGTGGVVCEWEAPWIEQIGDVPAGTKAIRLLGALDPLFLNMSAFHVTLNGVEIPLSVLPSGQLTGDASAFAGTTGTLRIQLDVDYRTVDTFPGSIFHLMDAVGFTPAPEPTSAALLALGMLGIAAVGRRHHR